MTTAARVRILIAASIPVCIALPLLRAWSTGAAESSASSAEAVRSALTDAMRPESREGDSGLKRVLLPIGLTLAGFLAVMLFGVVARFRPSKGGGAVTQATRARKRAARAQRPRRDRSSLRNTQLDPVPAAPPERS